MFYNGSDGYSPLRVAPNGIVVGNQSTTVRWIVAGAVKSDGTRRAGTGFSSTRESDGNYRITFDLAFDQTPIVVPTALGGDIQANVGEISNESVNIYVRNYKHWHNADLYFIAMDVIG